MTTVHAILMIAAQRPRTIIEMIIIIILTSIRWEHET
jgi:hypothetical protein